MSRESIEVRECDRCRHRVEVREFGQETGWGVVWSKAPPVDPVHHPNRVIGDERNGPADLCPTCVDELFDWWKSAPANPAPMPKAASVTVARKYRKQLVDVVTAQLREQVSESIDAVREQPTSILSKEIVPGAMNGVEERAKKLVDTILDGLS